MQHQEFDPPPALRDCVKCFWHNWQDAGPQPSSFEVLPDGYAEIVFYFGSACSIANDGGWQPLPSPFMVGLLNQPIHFRIQGRFDVIGIRCYPWTVFELLGLVPGKDGVRSVEHPIAQLQAGFAPLMKAGRVEEVLAKLSHFLLDIRSRLAVDSTLGKAGVAMGKANGSLPVSQVAAAAHASVRTLERKFKQSSAYSVKDVSGLMRFEQVRNQLWRDPTTNLAGLAHALGFTDQSHLSREFKRFSGTTPAAFARKARREKPLLGADFVAFVQA
jgi:AraC-like DNA-binding protein